MRLLLSVSILSTLTLAFPHNPLHHHQSHKRDFLDDLSDLPAIIVEQITTTPVYHLDLSPSSSLASADALSRLVKQATTRALLKFGNGRTNSVNQFAAAGSTSNVQNEQNSFIAKVTVSSGKTYNLIVDTGSSNTWAGAEQANPYKPGSTAQKTGNSFNVAYGSGTVSGTQYIDTITIGSLKVAKQQIGGAATSTKFSGVDGVLGLGPTALSQGSLSNSSAVAPTVVDNAFGQKLVPAPILGVFFPPGTGASANTAGQMTIGGFDKSKIVGSVSYSPITTKSPSNKYWGIDMAATAAGQTLFSNSAGVVDTGTTMVLFATDIFQKYKAMIPGAVIDPSTSFLRFPQSSLKKVPDITFTPAGSSPLVFRKYAQLVDPSIYSQFGLDSRYLYSWIGDLGSQSGAGLDFILGQKLLERFYSIYDGKNKRIGFGTTAYSNPQAFSG